MGSATSMTKGGRRQHDRRTQRGLPSSRILTGSSWATVLSGLAGAELAPVPETLWVLTELVAAAALVATPRPAGPSLPLTSAGMSFQ